MDEDNPLAHNLPAPGGMGGVFADPKHFRRTCRDVVQILQFNGVFSEHEVRRLVRAAKPMAMQAAKAGNSRNYTAVMRMLATLARLEQLDQPKQIEHDHSGTIGIVSAEQRRAEVAGILAALRERAGTEPPAGIAKANGHSGSNGHAHPPNGAAG